MNQEPQRVSREKIEEYLRFLIHAGETRFPVFAWGNLSKLSHFVNYVADFDINTENSLDNSGSNETMQEVLASLVQRIFQKFGGQKFRKLELLCFLSDLGEIVYGE